MVQLAGMPGGYSKSEITETLLVLLEMTEDQLYLISNNLEATALERTLSNAVINGLRTGDFKSVSFLLERSIGKPTEKIELDHTITELDIIILPDGTKLEL